MSYSIIMPALNEEKNLRSSVEMVREAFEGREYEILLIDDYSSDRTQEVGQELSNQFSEVILLSNDSNLGRGGSIMRGYNEASKELSIVIQAKKDTTANEIKKIIDGRGEEDLTLTYQENFSERALIRQALSYAFTLIVNIVSGNRIRYYNGSSLIKTSLIKELSIKNNSYSIDAEILVQLLRRGCSYKEIPVVDIFEKDRSTRAASLKNVLGVTAFLYRILCLRFSKMNS